MPSGSKHAKSAKRTSVSLYPGVHSGNRQKSRRCAHWHAGRSREGLKGLGRGDVSGITRRQLLQAGAGAGVVAMGWNPLLEQALAKKLPPGKLSDIEHVVILIQENRSFDDYFGMLPGVRGFGDKTVSQSVFEQPGYPVDAYEGVLLPVHRESCTGGGRVPHSPPRPGR